MRAKLLKKKLIILFSSIAIIIALGVAYEAYKIHTDPFVLFHFYNYESTDHGFQDFELPEKGRTLEMVEAAFQDYRVKTGKDDIELRITTKMGKDDDPKHRRWKYKYMEPSADDK